MYLPKHFLGDKETFKILAEGHRYDQGIMINGPWHNFLPLIQALNGEDREARCRAAFTLKALDFSNNALDAQCQAIAIGIWDSSYFKKSYGSDLGLANDLMDDIEGEPFFPDEIFLEPKLRPAQ